MANFFAHLSGSISKYKDGWKDFSIKDDDSNEINFSEEKFVSHTAHLLEFQKEFGKTQLMTSYFEEKKIHDKNKERQAAQFIADWVHYNRWKSKKCINDMTILA